MGGLFGGKQATVQPVADVPTVDNKSAELEAAAAESRRRVASGGRASDMLTGGDGVEGEAPVAKKKLLGN